MTKFSSQYSSASKFLCVEKIQFLSYAQCWCFSTMRTHTVTVPYVSVKAVTLVFIWTQRINMRTQPIHSPCIHYKGSMLGMLLCFINFQPSKCSFIFHANKQLGGKKALFGPRTKLTSLTSYVGKFSFSVITCEAWKFGPAVLEVTQTVSVLQNPVLTEFQRKKQSLKTF